MLKVLVLTKGEVVAGFICSDTSLSSGVVGRGLIVLVSAVMTIPCLFSSAAFLHPGFSQPDDTEFMCVWMPRRTE